MSGPPASNADGIEVELTEEPILAEPLKERVADPSTGATVEFLGTVRKKQRGARPETGRAPRLFVNLPACEPACWCLVL